MNLFIGKIEGEITLEYAFGPLIRDGGIEFRIWAPFLNEVSLAIVDQNPRQMERSDGGWHKAFVPGAKAGIRYQFVVADGITVPDPASRYQPEDVHGPSEVVDLTRYQWRSDTWAGRPWEETILYELHVGSFTKEGTFRAMEDKLDHLGNLGITALQIMPVADFPGRYNWGYDGVLPYAPDSRYGRPEDLLALVDAAHERGLSVILDVVYNHFGPDGNYMANYTPLFTERHRTPWGNGVNFDDEGSKAIREFIIQNAIYWIKEFRLDGLRLDAVHAIEDDSDEHVLHELARRVREAVGARHVHLIVENEDNDSDLLLRDENGHPLRYTAQWNDDIHHVLHVAATGEDFGYYQDYTGGVDHLGRALAEGFVYQGETMPYRGSRRGKPSGKLPPTAFISFVQNHDQIGNRAHGDRMITYGSLAALKAVTAIYLLSPQIPMLFMGEEWGAQEPFPYFCNFDEVLNEKIRQGRRKELSRLPGFDEGDLLDPTALSTFQRAKLDWSALSHPDAKDMLAFYKLLLARRREQILPLLQGAAGHNGSYAGSGGLITAEWQLKGGRTLCLTANLSDQPTASPHHPSGETIFSIGSRSGNQLLPWTVTVTVRVAETSLPAS
jgi:1,4-alpha-glucan branching enzyme/maltooligosyltrehalose trehalohydrolase